MNSWYDRHWPTPKLHPARVTAMARWLRSPTTSPSSRRLDYPATWRPFPTAWARFRDALPEADRDGSIVYGYARLLPAPTRISGSKPACDPRVTGKKATSISDDAPRPKPRYADPRYRMCFARLVHPHYLRPDWRAEGQLLDGVDRIAAHPCGTHSWPLGI